MSYLGKDRLITHWKMSDIWMESGYVDLRQEDYNNILFAPQVTPGELYYPDAVKSGEGQSPPYLYNAINNGDNPDPSYSKGMDSLSFKATAPGDGPGKKRRIWKVNDLTIGVEYATGKLKLALQAQFGTEDVDPGSTNAVDIPLSQFAVRSTQELTYALYTLLDDPSNPEYFLLTITSSTVSARQLEIKPSYLKRFKERLVGANDDERKKIEGYLLSRAKIKGVSISASFQPVIGRPFVYGWSANWLGTELAMVTNQRIETPVSVQYHTQRLYKLSVNINRGGDGDYQISAVNVKSQETDCTPRNNVDLLWVPNFALGEMQCEIWHGPSGYTDGFMDQEGAPLYAFYQFGKNGDEKLKVIRHSLKNNEVDDGNPFVLFGEWRKEPAICAEGEWSGEGEWTFNSYEEGGIYADDGGGAPDLPSQKTGVLFAASDVSVTLNGQNTNPSSAYSPFDELDVPPYCGVLADDSWFDETGISKPAVSYGADRKTLFRRTSGPSGSTIGESMMIIPLGADCAYIGTLEGTSAQVSYTDTMKKVYTKNISSVTGQSNSAQISKDGLNGGHTGLGIAPGTNFNGPLNGVSRWEQLFDLKFTLHSKHGERDPLELNVESSHDSSEEEATISAYFQLGAWTAWFDPPLLIDNTLEQLVFVQESAGFGTAIYTNDLAATLEDETEITDDELPDDLRPRADGLFVGWS